MASLTLPLDDINATLCSLVVVVVIILTSLWPEFVIGLSHNVRSSRNFAYAHAGNKRHRENAR